MASETKAGPGLEEAQRLKAEVRNLLGAVGDRALSSVRERVGDVTTRLSEVAEHGASPGVSTIIKGAREIGEGKSPAKAILGAGMTAVKEKVKNVFSGGGSGGDKKKITNIIESIDVGVPISLAYNQWTQFTDFPSFMKKVENVEQEADEKLRWKAQILWSHRTWESTITEQVPDDRIVWRSEGDKGYVDGAVTFHELAPNLTRINLVLEYHPQGFFEHTGNLWRAQGRRARLELKHFRRHVMTQTLLHPEEAQGWRGVIKEGEVASGPGEEDKGGRKKQGSSSASAGGRAAAAKRGRASGSQAGNGRRTSSRAASAGNTKSSTPAARRSSARSGGSSSGGSSAQAKPRARRAASGQSGRTGASGRSRSTTSGRSRNSAA
jgi:uncharacterized membrane protein